jgi:predicted ATPase
MMDIFFESVPIARKKRIHFNDFMIDVHKRLFQKKNQMKFSADHSLDLITNDIVSSAYLLCFDEFQVGHLCSIRQISVLIDLFVVGDRYCRCNAHQESILSHV